MLCHLKNNYHLTATLTEASARERSHPKKALDHVTETLDRTLP